MKEIHSNVIKQIDSDTKSVIGFFFLVPSMILFP